MDKLKENPFWAGIGAAGIILVVVFYFLVMSAWDESAKHNRQIQADLAVLMGNIPGNPDIDKWEKRQTDYNKDYDNIVKYYSTMDAELEKWMGGMSNPDSSRFTSKYNDMRAEMEKELTDAKIALGIPENEMGAPMGDEDPKFGLYWEEMTPDRWGAIAGDSQAVVRLLQKRFWVRRRIANVALGVKGKDGSPSVKRIRDVRFFGKLHAQFNQTFPPGRGVLDYPNDPTKLKGGFSRDFKEWRLPNDLGETIAFGFTVDMMYGDVPKFIREFLRPDMEPKLLVNIVGVQSYVLPENQNALEENLEWKEGQDNPDEVKKAFEQNVKPVPVTVQFNCRIVDFEKPKPAPATGP